MRTEKFSHTHASLLAALALLSGCGQQAYREAATTSPEPTVIQQPDTSTPAETFPEVPPYSFEFTIMGSETFEIPEGVPTDTVLKVRIKPGPAGLASGTGYTPVYRCVSYLVTAKQVGAASGKSIRTKVLAADGGGPNCAGAPDNQILDFSDRLGSGHGPMTITVSAVQTDWKYTSCVSTPWLYGAVPYGPYSCDMYKTMSALYQTHTATGTLDIQINGTGL